MIRQWVRVLGLPMDLVHDVVQGIHMLHWLTVAVPLATLVVVSGMLGSKKAARLLLVGIVATLASVLLTSVAPGSSHVRHGAPLAFARAGLDPLTGDPRTTLTILRACFVADLAFWCSGAVLLGALIQPQILQIRGLVARVRPARPRAHRRRSLRVAGSRA